MRRVSVLVAIAVLSVTVAAQNGDLDADVEQVRLAVSKLVGSGKKADFLLRDLSVLRGKVWDVDEDSFKVYPRKKKAGGIKVRYSNVLGISSKIASVSVVPDPAARSIGSWKTVSDLPVNRDIEIRLHAGATHKGRFRTATTDEMLIADAVTGKEVMLKREHVASVFVVRYGGRRIGDSAVSSSRDGIPIGSAFGNGSGKGLTGAVGAGVGALVGVIRGAATRSETMKVLIYSS